MNGTHMFEWVGPQTHLKEYSKRMGSGKWRGHLAGGFAAYEKERSRQDAGATKGIASNGSKLP
jgi:hypothetical protein